MNRVILLACVTLLGGCSSEVIDANASGHVVFLAQNVPQTVVMEALFDGTVTRDSAGCLRLGSSEPATVIWPKDFVALKEGDEIRIQDDRGHTIGRIGSQFRFGGGFVDSLHSGISLSAADRQRAAASCPGKYWIVGDTDIAR